MATPSSSNPHQAQYDDHYQTTHYDENSAEFQPIIDSSPINNENHLPVELNEYVEVQRVDEIARESDSPCRIHNNSESPSTPPLQATHEAQEENNHDDRDTDTTSGQTYERDVTTSTDLSDANINYNYPPNNHDFQHTLSVSEVEQFQQNYNDAEYRHMESEEKYHNDNTNSTFVNAQTQYDNGGQMHQQTQTQHSTDAETSTAATTLHNGHDEHHSVHHHDGLQGECDDADYERYSNAVQELERRVQQLQELLQEERCLRQEANERHATIITDLERRLARLGVSYPDFHQPYYQLQPHQQSTTQSASHHPHYHHRQNQAAASQYQQQGGATVAPPPPSPADERDSDLQMTAVITPGLEMSSPPREVTFITPNDAEGAGGQWGWGGVSRAGAATANSKNGNGGATTSQALLLPHHYSSSTAVSSLSPAADQIHTLWGQFMSRVDALLMNNSKRDTRRTALNEEAPTLASLLCAELNHVNNNVAAVSTTIFAQLLEALGFTAKDECMALLQEWRQHKNKFESK